MTQQWILVANGSLARFFSRPGAGDFSAWWLVASSPFLGELKAALSRPVSDRLQWVHEADYTGLGVGALEDRLHEHHRHTA